MATAASTSQHMPTMSSLNLSSLTSTSSTASASSSSSSSMTTSTSFINESNDSASILIDIDTLPEDDGEEEADNVEALNVLMQLDQILNACLMDDCVGVDRQEVSAAFSDDFVDVTKCALDVEDDDDEGDALQTSLDECLHDLDEYLRSYCTATPTPPDNDGGGECRHRLAVALLRRKTAKLMRSSSDCAGRGRCGELLRNHALRTTIAAIRTSGRCRHRCSNGVAPDDVVIPIDWQWLEAPPSAPPPPPPPPPPSGGVVDVGRLATESPPGPPASSKRTWLRTSMRRLRPLQMPVGGVVARTTTPSVMATTNARVPDLLLVGRQQQQQRPISAPSRIVTRSRSRSRERRPTPVTNHLRVEQEQRARSSSASSRSRRARSLSSVSSLPSSMDSSPSCTPIPTISHGVANGTSAGGGMYEQTDAENSNNVNHRTCDRSQRSSTDMPEAESPLGQWPHSMSATLAYVGCTLGIFNISRFAILSVHFGANFIFQFLLISLCIGVPLFTLHQCLGQQLAAGVVDMWRISPMFQGVGVSLLFFQVLTGLYSIVGISWMFVYFRDAFVTKFERYRWAEPFFYYRNEIQLPINGSYKLAETVPDYLSGVVLQRHHLLAGPAYGTIKFQPAFNLAVVWMIVFVSLSKGLRSYGKVIYVFTLLPVFGLVILCTKLLGLMRSDTVNHVFPETAWNEFFVNSRSWMAACQEVFLTWGMLGAAVMQIASHNKNKKLLQRDSGIITFITISVLVLAAFLANTCVHILKVNGYTYQPDSFEKLSTYTFLRHMSEPLPPNVASTPVKYMHHHSFIIGERVVRPGIDPATESGYQVLRFATELIPTTFSILGTDQVSPFWTVLFYFVLILFGIAQQLAIWHCVITGVMAIKAKVLKSWETTITFFSCACGFLLGLPMTTEYGIYVVYFMDLTVGGLWWLIVVILLQIVAVFMVRGRPYSGDILVTALFRKNGSGAHSNNSSSCTSMWIPVLLSFVWNVVLPVVLMVWCITFFKNGNFRELFVWHHGHALDYWPLWARQVGSLIQLLPVLGVPFIAVIQSYRYLNNGPNDILERIQLLYRPPLGEHMDDLAIQEAAAASMNTANGAGGGATNAGTEDPPPKYTPPPSYTTATGARIAKLLRQSFRRSVRRIANVLGEASGTRNRTIEQPAAPPPPDYNDVLVEMHHHEPETRDRRIQRELATIAASTSQSPAALTAADVACILRTSFRRSTVRPQRRNNGGTSTAHDTTLSSLSAENLVDAAAPIGETSLVLHLASLGDDADKHESTVI